MRLKTTPNAARTQPRSPVIQRRTKEAIAITSATSAQKIAVHSMTWKVSLVIMPPRCMKIGTIASGSAKLAMRRDQMAHFEVRMRMRMDP